MNNKINIVHLAPPINYSCGISRYLKNILSLMKDDPDYKFSVITSGGDSIDALKEFDVSVHKMPYSDGAEKALNFLPNYFQLLKFCNENNIKIIHSHHRYLELLSNLVGKKIEIKTITTVHSIVENYKRVSFKSDKLIAVSNSVKSHLMKKYGLKGERITQINNFIKPLKKSTDEEIKLKREELGIPNNDKILLFVGRLTDIKGSKYLLEAFENLFRKRRDVSLLIVGDVLDKNLKIKSDKIICTGPQEKVDIFYNMCDILLLPSIIDSFPYTMLEAGLASKPLIGGDTSGIKDFITNNHDGLLVPPENSAALKEAIVKLLGSSELRDNLGRNLNQTITKLPSGEEYIEKLKSIYSDLLGISK